MGVKRGDIIATIWINFILHGERQFTEFGKYHIERITSSFINKSCSINTVLEKRSIKFIWTLINSPNQLYNQIVKYSLYNCTTIIGENVRYFMNKYDISRDDWNSPINILYNKIDLYSTQHTLLDDICVATSIRELCESRDSEYTNFFDRNESRKLIDFLCTT